MGKLLKNSLAMSLTISSYLIMITVNVLANVLPINGISTGDVSNNYKNLFTPEPYTFSIWLLIYLALFAFVIYFCKNLMEEKPVMESSSAMRLAGVFSITCYANTFWIIAWHNEKLPITMILMVIILAGLIYIRKILQKMELHALAKCLIVAPFSIYFGWITIATIANATVLLVSLGFEGILLSEIHWTIIVLIIGLILGLLVTVQLKDPFYGAVFIWSYIGILLRHIGPSFGGNYQNIVLVTLITIGVILIAEVALLVKGNYYYGVKQNER